jgi:putative membrane-bound dehydrogenase-like protein
VKDAGVGSLTSNEFPVTQPFASFLIGGGQDRSTRVEIQVLSDAGTFQEIFTASGRDREAMQRVVVDLQASLGRTIRVQLIDENAGAWGHLNFDDFRFHRQRPPYDGATGAWRDTANPILQHLVPNPVDTEPGPLADDRAAVETLRQMHVPPGFSVQVVAAEPRVHQPMAFTFDGQGRIWVVEGHCYPERRPEGQGLDRILVFADRDGDGRFESRQVFFEGLNLVSALEVGFGGVWVGAAPELLFIPDADGDARADGPPVVLLDGFGYADTHETLNNFCWGPDGWLYGNQGVFNQSRVGRPGVTDSERVFLAAGVFRYHPQRHVFEVFAHGGSNQWGLDFDQHGQWFMTHCRSFWGGGPTTHVMPGGHYWNQVNSGYADFISPTGIDVQPAMKNYLLASARYGHGEGGAGKPGSRAVYGGHSHVGTMLYLGDNWPLEYRNRLFTHNLHGHQINQQENRRQGGGYETVHAGQDVLFCADPQYIGVDLKSGPDGAVYLSDWYDPRHCHNPNIEQWDRGNGRLYRLQYDATYRPCPIDLPRASDQDLVQLQTHLNDWHARAARLELAHRCTGRPLDPAALRWLRQWVQHHPESHVRLRCLWTLHVVGGADPEFLTMRFADASEYVRGWAVRLLAEGDGGQTAAAEMSSEVWRRVWELAQTDDSLLVKRELASASQRLYPPQAWKLVEVLAQQTDNGVDSGWVSLLWFAVAKLMRDDLAAGLRLAGVTSIPVLRDYIAWYAAKMSDRGRRVLITQIANDPPQQRYHRLRLLQHAMQEVRGTPPPDSWRLISSQLYESPDAGIRQAAELIGASFRDPELFGRVWRKVLASETEQPERIRGLAVLELDPSTDRLPDLMNLLQHPTLVKHVLPLLRKYEQAELADILLGLLNREPAGTQASILELLTSRATWANHLLDAVERERLESSLITAYHVRQMVGLGDPALRARLENLWGAANPSSAELQAQIRKLVATYEGAPLWAYDTGAGRKLYEQLCANCHQDAPEATRVAPQLAGSGSKGIHYLVENIVDPNAVVGRDFQARLVLTTAGRVVTGLVVNESETALTIRTATATETIAKDEIEVIKLSDRSFMPEGLLDALEERQRIELFKYLLTL